MDRTSGTLPKHSVSALPPSSTYVNLKLLVQKMINFVDIEDIEEDNKKYRDVWGEYEKMANFCIEYADSYDHSFNHIYDLVNSVKGEGKNLEFKASLNLDVDNFNLILFI